jgi:hypothetical protein
MQWNFTLYYNKFDHLKIQSLTISKKYGVGVVVPNRGLYIFGGSTKNGPDKIDRLNSINGAW